MTGLPWHYEVEDHRGTRYQYAVTEVKKAVELATRRGFALFRVPDDGKVERLLAPKRSS